MGQKRKDRPSHPQSAPRYLRNVGALPRNPFVPGNGFMLTCSAARYPERASSIHTRPFSTRPGKCKSADLAFQTCAPFREAAREVSEVEGGGHSEAERKGNS